MEPGLAGRGVAGQKGPPRPAGESTPGDSSTNDLPSRPPTDPGSPGNMASALDSLPSLHTTEHGAPPLLPAATSHAVAQSLPSWRLHLQLGPRCSGACGTLSFLTCPVCDRSSGPGTPCGTPCSPPGCSPLAPWPEVSCVPLSPHTFAAGPEQGPGPASSPLGTSTWMSGASPTPHAQAACPSVVQSL